MAGGKGKAHNSDMSPLAVLHAAFQIGSAGFHVVQGANEPVHRRGVRVLKAAGMAAAGALAWRILASLFGE